MYEANPRLTPKRVKGILMGTAFKTAAYRVGGGDGLVDATGAVLAATSDVANPNAGLMRSTGLGTLEGSRGRFHVETDLDGDGAAGPGRGRDGRPRRPVGLDLVVLDLVVVELLELHLVVVLDRGERRLVEHIVELDIVERDELEFDLMEFEQLELHLLELHQLEFDLMEFDQLELEQLELGRLELNG